MDRISCHNDDAPYCQRRQSWHPQNVCFSSVFHWGSVGPDNKVLKTVFNGRLSINATFMNTRWLLGAWYIFGARTSATTMIAWAGRCVSLLCPNVMPTPICVAIQYKSDGKHRNTLGCLDQYTCSGSRLWNRQDRETVYDIGICRGWRPRNSQACEAVKILMAVWWSCGGNVFLLWWNQKFWLLNSNLTLKIKANRLPKLYRDLNQGMLHLWSKLGDPSLNWWWDMVRRSWKWAKYGLLS